MIKEWWYDDVVYEKHHPDGYSVKATSFSLNDSKFEFYHILKMMFQLSDKLTLHTLNYLFNESFSGDDVTINFYYPPIIDKKYEGRIGSLFLAVKSELEERTFHLEFQMSGAPDLETRMMMHKFDDAISRMKLSFDHPMILNLTDQLIIYLAEDSKINDELQASLRLPDDKIYTVTIPVMRYGEYSVQQLVELKLYSLLPLQIFKYRVRMDDIRNSNKLSEEKSKLMSEQFVQLKDTMGFLVKTLKQLYDEKEILKDDLRILLSMIRGISNQLFINFDEFEEIKSVWDQGKTYH